jgi:hypothetical protein
MSDSLMHFGGGTRLDGPTLLGLTVALAVVMVAGLWLAKRFLGPEAGLLIIVVGVVCLGGIWSAGAWTDVTIDPAKREVVSRIGFLGLSAPGSTHVFADYKAVVVTLKRTSEDEAVTTTGSGFHKTATRTKTTYSYALGLKGYMTDRELPLKGDGKTPEEAEAWAFKVARLGDWPTLRRGYALDAATGGPTYRKVDFDAESPLEDPGAFAAGLAAGG